MEIVSWYLGDVGARSRMKLSIQRDGADMHHTVSIALSLSRLLA